MPESPVAAPESRAQRRATRRKRRAWPWIVATFALIALVVCAVWAVLVFNRAEAIRAELQSAQQLIPQVTASAKALDVETATADFEKISTHTAEAVALTDDPLWGAAGHLPWVGTSITAVSQLADITDYAVAAARPLIAAAPTLLPENLKPVDGVFPVDTLVSAGDTVAAASTHFNDLSARVAAVKTDGAIGQIVDAKATLTSALREIDDALDTADTLLSVLPTLLGADGEKRYLLVFQNNAEALGLGGSAASQTLIRADRGAIEIVDQGSSQTYEEERVDVELPGSAFGLYGSRYASAINLTPSRPDWPSDAQIMRSFWQRDIDPAPINGVASIDPLALQRLLTATGPVSVEGVEINADNAVSILLNEVYGWFPPSQVADATDAFFAETASLIFDKLSSGEFDVEQMLTAITESIESGSIMYWTDDEAVSTILTESGSRITGVLPTDNSETSTVGVYFRDTSSSKIDYYMDSAVDVSASCENDTMTLSASATLRLDLTMDESVNLPHYVRSGGWKGTKYRTQVFFYPPPGMEIADVSVDGRDVRPFRQGHVDLGRAVAPFEAYHQPGEEFTVTATFTGTGEFGPVEVRTTPMIRPTEVVVDDRCG